MRLRLGLQLIVLLPWLGGCAMHPRPLFDQDQDGRLVGEDCDDLDPAVGSLFADQDGDGQGGGDPLSGCAEAGSLPEADDCDDTDPTVFAGAQERCDQKDNDCDLEVDEHIATLDFFADDDEDDWGNSDVKIVSCQMPEGYVDVAGDCDDGDPAIHPGADEQCDGVDNDCDGGVDDADPEGIEGGAIYYRDQDRDSFGRDDLSEARCEADSFYTTLEAGDCDDSLASVYPGAPEACNLLDDDCDGKVDEDATLQTTPYYPDLDHDGFGGSGTPVPSCAPPPAHSATPGDCDDGASSVYPGALEASCDGVDGDCDGLEDDHPDADGDGYDACAPGDPGDEGLARDCADGDPKISPAGVEDCNGVDDDCDGGVDEGTGPLWYRDGDGDGYGNSSVSAQACQAPAQYVSSSSDCDDGAASVHPGAVEQCNGVDDNCDGESDSGNAVIWYKDGDGDGYGASSQTVEDCDPPAGYVSTAGDCDDGWAASNPGAVEACNGLDDNCDAQVDEGVTTSFYKDGDGDGYGWASSVTQACVAPKGYVTNALDCNDGASSVSPAAMEQCNGVDDDCSGVADDGIWSTVYRDEDGDGMGDGAQPASSCPQAVGYVANGADCNDANASIYPGAVEVCDGLDNDCDHLDDEGLTGDGDGDGYAGCGSPADCNDGNAAVYPGAAELCNGADEDCDGEVDEGQPRGSYFQDGDGDGYGNPEVFITACMAPAGYVLDASDCDDGRGYVHPGATEVCNGFDDDCDGMADDGVQLTYYEDLDGDGYGNGLSTTQACTAVAGYVSNDLDCDDRAAGIYPGAPEVTNGVDDNCNGEVDEVLEVIQVEAGESFSVALLSDGTLRAWGANGYGQLGDGTLEERATPVLVRNLQDVVSVSCGSFHVLAVTADGQVWSWGANYQGQLGDGTLLDRSLPAVVDGVSDAVQVAAGAAHSVALRSDGTVWVWGWNGSGQLGTGSLENAPLPVMVQGLANIEEVAAGLNHTLALTPPGVPTSGEVWAWGLNGSGQLGDGTINNRSLPVRVRNLSDVRALDAGRYHSLALRSDKTAWSWGENSYGQLGVGTTADGLTPAQVPGLTGVVGVAGGGQHSLAVVNTGLAFAWGRNQAGQLGDGTTATRNNIVPIKGMTGVSWVAGGEYHTLLARALSLDAPLDGWACGLNRNGQLGDGSHQQRLLAVEVSDLP